MITIASLIACGVKPTQARIFEQPLAAACERFDINTRPRAAAFLGQVIVESSGFTDLEEDLYYRADRIWQVFVRLRGRGRDGVARLAGKPEALANAAYAHVNGNGSEATGDGWRYRGRGLKMLTGLDNYRDAEIGLGRPYVSAPALVALPPDACLTAAWYWHNVKANQLADAAMWDAITKAVNGRAMLQADRRRAITLEALQVL